MLTQKRAQLSTFPISFLSRHGFFSLWYLHYRKYSPREMGGIQRMEEIFFLLNRKPRKCGSFKREKYPFKCCKWGKWDYLHKAVAAAAASALRLSHWRSISPFKSHNYNSSVLFLKAQTRKRNEICHDEYPCLISFHLYIIFNRNVCL